MKSICIISAVIFVILASNEVIGMMAVLGLAVGFIAKICKEAIEK